MPSQPSPLQRYLTAQQRSDRELAIVLRNAADDAEDLMTKLGRKYTFSAEMRRAQISLVLRELRTQQALLWGQVDDLLGNQLTYAADAAADAEEFMTDDLFRRGLGTSAMEELKQAYRAQAQATVRAYQARTALGIPLSQQVYKTSAWSTGLLERRINSGILLGKSAAELAKDVKDLIRPDVRGGVAYAAKRLARTELNNAFHEAQKTIRSQDPFITGMKWNLSGSHPHADDCDVLAGDTHFSGGRAGEFRADQVPGKPHPQCLCYLSSIPISSKEFTQRFVNGDFNSYIDNKIARYNPQTVSRFDGPFGGKIATRSTTPRYMADNSTSLVSKGMTESGYNGAEAKSRLGEVIAAAERGELRKYQTVARGKDPDLDDVYEITYQGVEKQALGKEYHTFEMMRTGPRGFRHHVFSNKNYTREDIQDAFDVAEWDFPTLPAPAAPRPLISPKSPGAMTDEDMAIIWVKTKDRIARELGINPKGATKELDDRTYKAIADETGYKPAEVKAKLDAYRQGGKKLSVLKKKVLKGDPKTRPSTPKAPRKVPTKPTPKVVDDVLDKTKKEIADDPGPVYQEAEPGYNLFDAIESELERFKRINHEKKVNPYAESVDGGPTFFYQQVGNVNCVSCSFAHELVLRGLKVRALPDLETWQKYISTYKTIWKAEVKNYEDMVFTTTGKAKLGTTWKKELAADMPEGARGTITTMYNKGGGHIFNWRKHNGRIEFSDAQINDNWSTDHPTFHGNKLLPLIQIMRLDNLPTPPASIMRNWVEIL